MDNGTYQGSYALITSDILKNTFYQLSQSQNGLGLQTFAYFSGIPWEDPRINGVEPYVADAIVLSYVTYNNQFTVDTVNNYNNYDLTTNRVCGSGGCYNVGNQNIGINVGGDTYLSINFPIFMYEYGWTSGGAKPGNTAGYYVGILQYNSTKGLGYFLTTQYTNNPNPEYYDYYYSGSGWGYSLNPFHFGPYLNYYFVENNNGNIQGYSGYDYFAFIPLDQQNNQNYYQYGVFWLYNWFQEDNNNMNIFFLMNGNIFNYSLASEQYSWECGCVFFICFTCSAYAIPPNPPASTINGEPIFVQSYINAYNTAFNQPVNSQVALYMYSKFYPTFQYINSDFIPGTFGYYEGYNNQGSNLGNSITISYLKDDANYYDGNSYLFVSAGSGGGSGFMYLDWIIATYGVPYIVSVS